MGKTRTPSEFQGTFRGLNSNAFVHCFIALIQPAEAVHREHTVIMAKKNKQMNVEDEGEILDDVLSDEEVVSPEKKDAEDQDVNEDTENKEETEEKEDKESEETTVATADVPIDVKEPVSTNDEAPEVPSKDATTTESKDVPPAKPKRPLTPRQEAVKSLKEAFPTVEDKYITSHLIASNFHLENAFNALLYLSDPESINLDEVTMEEPAPPSLPQRRQELTQLEQDELLAKQLDEEFRHKQQRRERRQQDMRRRRVEDGQQEDDDDDTFANFVEKDLPQIKEQFSKNIEETKNKINTWVSGWKKQYSSTQQELNNRQIKKQVRDEFDEDPEELDLQKFHGIKLSDDTEETTASTPAKGRSRALSTDLYGTPKHPQEKDKKEDVAKAKGKDAKPPLDDDDFNLSE